MQPGRGGPGQGGQGRPIRAGPGRTGLGRSGPAGPGVSYSFWVESKLCVPNPFRVNSTAYRPLPVRVDA